MKTSFRAGLLTMSLMVLAAGKVAPSQVVVGNETINIGVIAAIVRGNPISRTDRQSELGGWQSIAMPQDAVYRVVGFASADDGWAFGEAGAAHWNGQTWAAHASSAELRLVRSVALLSSNDGWAVGSRGLIFHWDGIQWTRKPAPTSDEDVLDGVAFASSDLGWAVGVTGKAQPSTLRGVVLKWNGQEWIRQENLPTDSPVSFVEALSENEAWIGGTPSVLMRWNGQSWNTQELTAPGVLDFYAMAAVKPNDVWMVGETETNEGTIWHWDGVGWTENRRTRLPLYSISMVSSDFGWAVGGNGLWKKIENGSLLMHWNGETWADNAISTTTPLRVVSAQSKTDGWLLGGGPTDLINGEYEGVAFRYRIQTVAATILPTLTPHIVATPPPSADSFATRPIIPTVTVVVSPSPTLPPQDGGMLRNALLVAGIGLAVVLSGFIVYVFVRQRRV